MFSYIWKKIKSLLRFERGRADRGPSIVTPVRDREKEIDGQLHSQLWAIGGGKGGVGKSLITLLLGTSLTRWGKKVVLVDADLGGGNLNMLTGNKYPQYTLGDFMQKRIENIEDITLDTPVKNLKVICGADEIVGMANPKSAEKAQLFNSLKKLEADVILLDLGAGTSLTTLDCFLFAPHRIIVLSPQATAIQNAYGFLKSCLHRKLSLDFKHDADSMKIINRAINGGKPEIETMAQLLNEFSSVGGEQMARLSTCIHDFKTGLVVNMAREQKDVNLGRSMIKVANEYLSLDPEYFGFIEYDRTLERNVNRMECFLNEGADTITKIGFYDLANKVVNKLYRESRVLAQSGSMGRSAGIAGRSGNGIVNGA